MWYCLATLERANILLLVWLDDGDLECYGDLELLLSPRIIYGFERLIRLALRSLLLPSLIVGCSGGANWFFLSCRSILVLCTVLSMVLACSPYTDRFMCDDVSDALLCLSRSYAMVFTR